jgi:ribosome-binding factor A
MRAKKPYHKRRPAKRQIELLCGEIGPGDGSDPRYDRPESGRNRGSGRKALQLCRQVQEALGDALCTTCRDPVLNELQVHSVEPAPNTSRLLVTLFLESRQHDASQVATHLQGAAGLLRCEVAAAIHRKKVPELAFRVVSP